MSSALKNLTPEQLQMMREAVQAFSPAGAGSQRNRRAIKKLQIAVRGILATRTAENVQELQALGEAQVSEGDAAIITTTGNTWIADSVGPTSSTWRPGNGLYDVRDYGAVLDGVTDDQPSVQAAVNDAEAAGGGVVDISSTDILWVESTITIDSGGITVRGRGYDNDGTWVRAPTSMAAPIFLIEGSHRVTIEKMRIGWGTSVGLASGMDAIRFSGVCGWLVFRDLHLHGVNRGISSDVANPTVTFSSLFSGVYIAAYAEYGLFNSPVGSGDTGSVIQNLYITNSGTPALRPTRAIFWGSSIRSSVWDQINVEHATFDSASPVYIASVGGLEINAIHFEEVTLDFADSNKGLFEVASSSVVDVRSVNIEALNTAGNGQSAAIFYVNDFGNPQHPQIIVGMITQLESNINAADDFNIVRGRANLDVASGWRCSIGHIQTDYAYDAPAGPGLDLSVSEVNGVSEYDGHPFAFTHTFAADDATPSVLRWRVAKTANANPTTITALDDGFVGQSITVIIDDNNTTVDFTGTTLKGNGGADWSPTQGDHMVCQFDGVDWYCVISDNTP